MLLYICFSAVSGERAGPRGRPSDVISEIRECVLAAVAVWRPSVECRKAKAKEMLVP